MDKYKKMGLIAILKMSIFFGMVGFFPAFAIKKTAFEISDVLILILLILVVFAGQFYYLLKNMESHDNLKMKYGDTYIKKLENRLKDEGMRPLLLRQWFVKLENGEIET